MTLSIYHLHKLYKFFHSQHLDVLGSQDKKIDFAPSIHFSYYQHYFLLISRTLFLLHKLLSELGSYYFPNLRVDY